MAALGGSATGARSGRRHAGRRRLPLAAHGQGCASAATHPSLRLHPVARAHAPGPQPRRRNLSTMWGQDEARCAGSGAREHRPLFAPPWIAHRGAAHGSCPRATVLAEPRPAPPLRGAARGRPGVGIPRPSWRPSPTNRSVRRSPAGRAWSALRWKIGAEGSRFPSLFSTPHPLRESRVPGYYRAQPAQRAFILVTARPRPRSPLHAGRSRYCYRTRAPWPTCGGPEFSNKP
jgi:hypothetical protein